MTDADAGGAPQESLRARVFQLASRKHIPLTASIELTQRCNLSCLHCYNFDRSRPMPAEQVDSELTPDEIHGVIDELADAGSLFLSFTGGEALLHPHLFDFIEHARRRRFSVRLKSSGVLLDQSRVERLAAAGVSAIDVSLYGSTPATHDAFTDVPGSFSRTRSGIEQARQAGLATRVNICVTRHNAGEVGEMMEMAEALGCTVGVDPFLTARYDGTTSSLDHSVSGEQLEALYRGPLRHYLRQPDPSVERGVQCACAVSNCGISSGGEVYPCIGAPVPSGNIRKQSFAEIWKSSPQLNAIRALQLEDFELCARCPARPYCRRNSGVVYSNTGDYTGPEPLTCLDAEITAEVLGVEGIVSSPHQR